MQQCNSMSLLTIAVIAVLLGCHDCANADYSNIVRHLLPQQSSSRQTVQAAPSFLHSREKGYTALDGKKEPEARTGSVKLCETVGTSANCSHRGINDTGQLRQLPSDITRLDLSFNSLRDIPDHAFAKFARLRWLKISHNLLQGLNNNSFYNLSELTELNLQSNNLSMTQETFPAAVFEPLVNLTKLRINNNTLVNVTALDYPEQALAPLKTLKVLHMDGLPNRVFGRGFSQMESLANLTLEGDRGGYCNLQSLPADMFTNLTRLTKLTLIHCQINGTQVDHTVFVPLTKLEYLDVSNNDGFRFEGLGAALEQVKNYKTFKILNMTNIVNPYAPAICVTSNFTNSLPRYLEILNATSNSLETFEDGALLRMPKTLKFVDIGSNRFIFWSYLKDLGELKSLETLIISGGTIYRLPWYYPPGAEVKTQCDTSNLSNPVRHGHLVQPLPPKLDKLDIISYGLSNYLTEFHFREDNNLTHLNLDSNNFPILKGPITGLNRLVSLSMQECKIAVIYPTFFQNFTSLEVLNLHSNYFGHIIFNDGKPFVFSKLRKLQVLDLSFAYITYMTRNALFGLTKLTTLYLQSNPFADFDVDISKMTDLMYINFSSTNLKTLDYEITQTLDSIRKNSTNLTIEFTVNALSCVCSNLDFLKWMTSTPVTLNSSGITCAFIDGSEKAVKSLKDEYYKLQRECISNTGLLFIVISTTLLLLIAIICAIVFRFRWKLRYLYYSAILHYREIETKECEDDSFEYDVFVSYAHEDHTFVVEVLHPHLRKHGMKVHIHGLHFVAGEYISSNIVNAVQSSRRTLVIVTQPHINSKWCKFEVEMANMEQVHTGRRVLLFLMKGDNVNLTAQMLYHIKNNTYIAFPKSSGDGDEGEGEEGDAEMQVFWSKLVSDLTT